MKFKPTLNQQGIYAPLVRKQPILWESIYSYTLGKDSKLLFLVIEENGKKRNSKSGCGPTTSGTIMYWKNN